MISPSELWLSSARQVFPCPAIFQMISLSSRCLWFTLFLYSFLHEWMEVGKEQLCAARWSGDPRCAWCGASSQHSRAGISCSQQVAKCTPMLLHTCAHTVSCEVIYSEASELPSASTSVPIIGSKAICSPASALRAHSISSTVPWRWQSGIVCRAPSVF